MDSPIFITKEQINNIKKAKKIIEDTLKEINIEAEEYLSIKSSLYYLNFAIQVRNYS